MSAAETPRQAGPLDITDKNGFVDHAALMKRLEVIDTIGTGTFGRVILCRSDEKEKVTALKVMKVSELIRLKQVQHVHSEKETLLAVKHPFIVGMHWAAKSDQFIYLMLEYLAGGELFAYLRNAGNFSDKVAMFFAAETISALDYLHELSIVYRDLKPENLLLDHRGHLKLTDFGFAKRLVDRTWTLCGTPEYLAPEIIQSKGHNKAVDWWALGILIYEMLVGIPPFYDEKPFGIYEKILAGKIDWPKSVERQAKDLIKKLLVQDRTRRLGNMKNGSADIKTHKWFKSISWDDVRHEKLPPPIVPVLTSETDTGNFDDYGSSDEWFSSTATMGSKELSQFADF